MAAIGQLSQRLAKQREEIDQLRIDQHVQFQTLTEKFDGLAQILIGAQRSALTEHAKEQRILMLIHKTGYKRIVIIIACSLLVCIKNSSLIQLIRTKAGQGSTRQAAVR
jgi:uncharacterized coiled-coil protein SlyX